MGDDAGGFAVVAEQGVLRTDFPASGFDGVLQFKPFGFDLVAPDKLPLGHHDGQVV